MKKSFLFTLILFSGIITGYAQKDKIIYLTFTSTNDVTNGKVHKRISDKDNQHAIFYTLQDKEKGYEISLLHRRYDVEEIPKINNFNPNLHLMEEKHIKLDQIDGEIIDLDKKTVGWTKENAREFVKELRSARKIYFIDKRDINKDDYLIRQVRFLSSNVTEKPVISREELLKVNKNNVIDVKAIFDSVTKQREKK